MSWAWNRSCGRCPALFEIKSMPGPFRQYDSSIDRDRVRRIDTIGRTLETRVQAASDVLPEGSPDRGELMRRERLYHSHIGHWRGQQQKGTLPATSENPREPGGGRACATSRGE
jgi:hypothetical protein